MIKVKIEKYRDPAMKKSCGFAKVPKIDAR